MLAQSPDANAAGALVHVGVASPSAGRARSTRAGCARGEKQVADADAADDAAETHIMTAPETSDAWLQPLEDAAAATASRNLEKHLDALEPTASARARADGDEAWLAALLASVSAAHARLERIEARVATLAVAVAASQANAAAAERARADRTQAQVAAPAFAVLECDALARDAQTRVPGASSPAHLADDDDAASPALFPGASSPAHLADAVVRLEERFAAVRLGGGENLGEVNAPADERALLTELMPAWLARAPLARDARTSVAWTRVASAFEDAADDAESPALFFEPATDALNVAFANGWITERSGPDRKRRRVTRYYASGRETRFRILEVDMSSGVAPRADVVAPPSAWQRLFRFFFVSRRRTTVEIDR